LEDSWYKVEKPYNEIDEEYEFKNIIALFVSFVLFVVKKVERLELGV